MAEEEVDDAKKRIKRVQLEVDERRRKEEDKRMVERVSTWLRGNTKRERGGGSTTYFTWSWHWTK